MQFISSIHITENGIISKDGWFNPMLLLPAHNRHSAQPDCLLFLFIAVCHSIILFHVFSSRSLFISNFFSLSLEIIWYEVQSTMQPARHCFDSEKIDKTKRKMIKNRNYVLSSVIYCLKWRCIDENSSEKAQKITGKGARRINDKREKDQKHTAIYSGYQISVRLFTK